MKFARVSAGCAMFAVFLLLSSGGVTSQEKKDPKAPRIRGQIPTGWGKLKLDAAQKQNIYTIQAEYKEKIVKLEAEIQKLEEERYRKMVGVLKPEQKKILTQGLIPDSDTKTKSKDSKD